MRLRLVRPAQDSPFTSELAGRLVAVAVSDPCGVAAREIGDSPTPHCGQWTVARASTSLQSWLVRKVREAARPLPSMFRARGLKEPRD